MNADLATITAAIGAATAGVQLIDKIGDQVVRFLTKGQEPAVPVEHRVKIERDGNAIVEKHHGGEVKRISIQDLEKLPGDQLRHIRTLEKAMENHYTVWESVYPQLALETNLVAKAKTEQQLKGVVSDMKNDLLGILAFLESAGLYLDDHYLTHTRRCVKSLTSELSRAAERRRLE